MLSRGAYGSGLPEVCKIMVFRAILKGLSYYFTCFWCLGKGLRFRVVVFGVGIKVWESPMYLGPEGR